MSKRLRSPSGSQDELHRMDDKIDVNATNVQTPAPNVLVTSAISAYVEPLELKTQSNIARKEAWLAWRKERSEDRKWAFARLRDALALQETDMIERWKNRMIELGYDDPIESMPSFED